MKFALINPKTIFSNSNVGSFEFKLYHYLTNIVDETLSVILGRGLVQKPLDQVGCTILHCTLHLGDENNLGDDDDGDE